MRTACRLVALALLLAGVCVASGQGPGTPEKPKPEPKKSDEKPDSDLGYYPPAKALVAKAPQKSKLEEMLAQALLNNPDILGAKARQEATKANLLVAEAEVNRAILQVAQKVTSLYQAVESQKAIVASVQDEWAAAKNWYEAGKVTIAEFAQARGKLEAAKAKLAELESELSLVLGKAPAGAEGLRIGQADSTCVQCHQNPSRETWDEKIVVAAHKVIGLNMDWLMTKKATKGPVAEKIRQALDQPITVEFKQQPADKVIKELLGKFTGVPVLNRLGLSTPIDLEVKEPIPLGAVLQMLSDKCDNFFQLVIREYGILVTPRGQVPPGAITLDEFWKKSREKTKDGGDKKPGEGEVRTVDSKSGLVQLSIGSDVGLKEGQIVHVFRLADKPAEAKYLGTLRILQVQGTDAVAEPLKGRGITESPRPGDRVAVQLTGH
jgi:hypothetical protein